MSHNRVAVTRFAPSARLTTTRTDPLLDPLLRREGTSRNGWQPTADALLTMERRTQPVAAGGNGFRLFLRFQPSVDFAAGCHRLQPRGSIKAPPPALRSTGSASTTRAHDEPPRNAAARRTPPPSRFQVCTRRAAGPSGCGWTARPLSEMEGVTSVC